MALAVDKTDVHGVAQRVAKTYDERRGALGSFVSQVFSGPSDEDQSARLYAERPAGMSDDEARVYDMTVRVGDAHEFESSGESFTITLDDIGDDSTRFDPLAMVSSRFHRVWGLQDYGVARDLTANRFGAAFGLELFRSPTSAPVIPHDDGKSAAKGTFASIDAGGRAIPFAHYAAHESALVAILRGTLRTEDAATRWPTLVAEVNALGEDAANARVEGKVLALVDELLQAGDSDRLARYYGSFAARHLRWGERLVGFTEDEDGFYASDPVKHRDWALQLLQNRQGAEVRAELKKRLQQTFSST